MNIVFAFLSLVLVIVALVGFLLLIVGTPVGIVLAILYFGKNEKQRDKRFKKWMMICFSGIPLLIAVFILWALLQLISTFLGVNLSPVPMN